MTVSFHGWSFDSLAHEHLRLTVIIERLGSEREAAERELVTRPEYTTQPKDEVPS